MTIYLLGHKEVDLESFPESDEITKVNLESLDYLSDSVVPGWFSRLSENRIFLSDRIETGSSETVFLASTKIMLRYQKLDSLEKLLEVNASIVEGSAWYGYGVRVDSDFELKYWIENQELVHPGVKFFLDEIKRELFPFKAAGYFTLGNHFALSKNDWSKFRQLWRDSFAIAKGLYDSGQEIGFGCMVCYRPKPGGYFRYGPERDLAFLGERISSLILSHMNLRPVELSTCQPNTRFALLSSSPDWLQKTALRLVKPALVAIRYPRRKACAVCRDYNPGDTRYLPLSAR